MKTNVYCKDTEGKLQTYSVGTEDVAEARNAVKDMLETTKAAYVGQAVLGVVQGGK